MGEVQQDPREAIKYYRRAAERGDSNAQYKLGQKYYKGDGVEKDVRAAVRWYQKAAKQEVLVAQWQLGIIYSKDHEGLPKDECKALECFKIGAELAGRRIAYDMSVSNFLACLGFMYQNGKGTARDTQMAGLSYQKKNFRQAVTFNPV